MPRRKLTAQPTPIPKAQHELAHAPNMPRPTRAQPMMWPSGRQGHSRCRDAKGDSAANAKADANGAANDESAADAVADRGVSDADAKGDGAADAKADANCAANAEPKVAADTKTGSGVVERR